MVRGRATDIQKKACGSAQTCDTLCNFSPSRSQRDADTQVSAGPILSSATASATAALMGTGSSMCCGTSAGYVASTLEAEHTDAFCQTFESVLKHLGRQSTGKHRQWGVCVGRMGLTAPIPLHKPRITFAELASNVVLLLEYVARGQGE